MSSLAGFLCKGSHFLGRPEPLLGVSAHPDRLVFPRCLFAGLFQRVPTWGLEPGRRQGYGGRKYVTPDVAGDEGKPVRYFESRIGVQESAQVGAEAQNDDRE